MFISNSFLLNLLGLGLHIFIFSFPTLYFAPKDKKSSPKKYNVSEIMIFVCFINFLKLIQKESFSAGVTKSLLKVKIITV